MCILQGKSGRFSAFSAVSTHLLCRTTQNGFHRRQGYGGQGKTVTLTAHLLLISVATVLAFIFGRLHYLCNMTVCRNFLIFFALLSFAVADSSVPAVEDSAEPESVVEAAPEPTEPPVEPAPDPDGAVESSPEPLSESQSESEAPQPVAGPRPPEPEATAENPASVYVIPVTGVIDKPNLFILRRGLKEAIANGIDMVILDMDTPGGRVDYTIDMMEMLSRFDGITATYVNEDAISAGSFIAAATREIYFAPRGKMGASAVIQGGGQDVPEAARMKIESYLRANIRVLSQDFPYRGDVIRAMLDAQFELEIDGEVLKPAGELLTLTAREAVREFGDPPHKLLAEGIYDSIDELLDARFGAGNYVIRDFELTYSEAIAKWMNTFASALLGLGILLLFIEFKTPGFGFFGIAGLILLGIFFASQYIAGLAGNEAILIFVLGVVLVMVEVFLFPGTIVFALTGLLMMLGALLWAMVDVWPGTPVQFDAETFARPFVDLTFGLAIAIFGGILAARMLPGSFLERRLVLADSAGGDSQTLREARTARLPPVGTEGVAVTTLFPSGHIEVGGVRYDARSSMGMIRNGSRVRVVKSGDFDLVVEEVPE